MPPFLLLLWAVMATGTYLVREPAPFDLGILLLGGVALFAGGLAFSRAHRLLFLLLGAFLTVNILCLQFAADRQVAQSYLATTAYLAVSAVCFAGILSRFGTAGWSVLMSGYAVSGVVSSVFSVLAYCGMLGFRGQLLLFGRPKGWFKDPNVFGPYLVLIVVYAMARLERPRTRLAAAGLWVVALLAAALGVCLAFSRACWINCAVSVAVYFGLRIVHGWRFGGINRRFLRVLVFTSVALAVTAAALLANPSIQHMLEIRLGQGGLQDYDAVRFYTHDRAWETAGRKPLGLGPGQSEVIFAYSTHSMYLRVLAENGVPGFVLFFGAVFWGIGRSLRAALGSGQAETAVLAAFVAACMAGILVNGAVIDVNHWRHFWLLLAMAWCCPITPAEERCAYAPGVYQYARG
jgi:hypothetical protein